MKMISASLLLMCHGDVNAFSCLQPQGLSRVLSRSLDQDPVALGMLLLSPFLSEGQESCPNSGPISDLGSNHLPEYVSLSCSTDVEKLKKLVLHNPVTLTLMEDVTDDSIVPKSVQQFLVQFSLLLNEFK